MKCLNCGKEVSPEFNVCPWCGYKPKKCSKPEHQDVWLPDDARFCPRCGNALNEVDNDSDYVSIIKNEDRNVNQKSSLVSDDGTVFEMDDSIGPRVHAIMLQNLNVLISKRKRNRT